MPSTRPGKRIGEMDREPKSIGVTPPSTDQRQIFWRKRIVPDNCRRICRRIEQRGPGLRRKDFVLLHRRPPLLLSHKWWRCSLAGNSKITILGEESVV